MQSAIHPAVTQSGQHCKLMHKRKGGRKVLNQVGEKSDLSAVSFSPDTRCMKAELICVKDDVRCIKDKNLGLYVTFD